MNIMTGTLTIVFNDLENGGTTYRDVNVQVTPREVDNNFSELGLEMDLITTLEQFHDPVVIAKHELTIYNDSNLYDTPFNKLINNEFLYDYIETNYSN